MVIRDDHRKIVKRFIILGNLILKTPTCLGSGDRDGLTDMVLLRDSISDRALLPGASLGGALRNYLQERLVGYRLKQEEKLLTQLFGGSRGDENGEQSALIIHDSISQKPPNIEFRDGVRINPSTGIAVDKAKYDLELVAAGTIFPLMIELLVEQNANLNELKQGLAIALIGLEAGEIALGMKKRRGFGHCEVAAWQVDEFDLTQPQHLRNWLNYDHEIRAISNATERSKIASQLVDESDLIDQRKRLTLTATFEVQDGLLIRAGQDAGGIVPDVIHLVAKQKDGQIQPVIPGTSWTGVLRHRAERILRTLGNDIQLIESMFGYVPENRLKDTAGGQASRLVVQESMIQDSSSMVQTRIAIDLFTGGALHGALLQEQPIFGGEVTLKLELRNPEDYEIGLLLLLLKDLWTGDLPVGGSSSVGRGRLQGKTAKLNYRNETWTIKQQKRTNGQQESELAISDAQRLEEFVQQLMKQLKVEVVA